MNYVSSRAAAGIGLGPEFASVRAYTEQLAAKLTAEDQCVQSMPDASPAKWHRAHTTWFFEEFILRPYEPHYRPCDPAFRFLFNSYYESVGARHPRPSRGMITRPSADAVTEYRAHVDAALLALIASGRAPNELVTLGLQHEQQHQELLATDMLHAFAQSPLTPALFPDWSEAPVASAQATFLRSPGGVVQVGYDGDGFSFDNETPRHDVLLRPFRIADRLVRNRDWLNFIVDGGYRAAGLWMSDGWSVATERNWSAPLYWRNAGADGWSQMGPGGVTPLDPDAPVRHISWYEADAFSRWAGARLPTEFEFEHAAATLPLYETTGHVWQWTGSAYLPYPGFVPPVGAIGEYNGKFMINQMVLRGGSCMTPPGQARLTYRNFFHPDKRWQFSGLRLAHED